MNFFYSGFDEILKIRCSIEVWHLDIQKIKPCGLPEKVNQLLIKVCLFKALENYTF